jgi:hypothetical protein
MVTGGIGGSNVTIGGAMIGGTWYDALKYGPTLGAGLAGLALLWTAGLLTIELNRTHGVRESAYRAIKGFMYFSAVLFAASVLLTFVDNRFKASDEKDKTLSQIREDVSSIKSDVLTKMGHSQNLKPGASAEECIATANSALAEVRRLTVRICHGTNHISELVGSSLQPIDCDPPRNSN